jgi:hypothetical protein
MASKKTARRARARRQFLTPVERRLQSGVVVVQWIEPVACGVWREAPERLDVPKHPTFGPARKRLLDYVGARGRDVRVYSVLDGFAAWRDERWNVERFDGWTFRALPRPKRKQRAGRARKPVESHASIIASAEVSALLATREALREDAQRAQQLAFLRANAWSA